MNASQSAARRHTVPALYLGSEGAPTASDSGGCVNSRAAGERRQL
jgi:hypothetical protein